MTIIRISIVAALLATPVLGQEFNLDAMIKAAKAEPPITIYDSTGKIVDMAEAFTAKYGVQATGQKVSANSQLEMLIREAQAGNVQGDVALLTDTPAAIAQLLPTGVLESWVPPDLEETIPARYRNPLAISTNANVWAYNTGKYPECPVTNIWQLTESEWKGKVALIDPLTKGTYTDWFNQMATYGDEPLRAAYQAQYGKPLESDQPSAAAAWLAAMGANAPLMADGDDRISEAVGAAGQEAPFMGLLSSAKFRDNADKGYQLGLCAGMDPWPGWTYTKLGLIASGTDSPNAARLFIHYILTEEGIMPQMRDGKMPTSTAIKLPEDEPSGLADHAEALFAYDASSGLDDWDRRQDWQDFWRVHYTR
ncbi:ABC transporter substrate-binding protein [Paracoccus sp. CPCC 101403]|uniref:ABC transporter substrate-binding protein n=1 Tax=Paracoccus broussonetiae TaxID=3075834 RepID=A0ABU3EHS3_9RHOB|nr:ABC transporter substrate-binding protein [Paracoccus sp. CPCC 101403]MDT1063795.1 ABC transporter substrate-binding protein [Paracoccus sp. CPCC 101403]